MNQTTNTLGENIMLYTRKQLEGMTKNELLGILRSLKESGRDVPTSIKRSNGKSITLTRSGTKDEVINVLFNLVGTEDNTSTKGALNESDDDDSTTVTYTDLDSLFSGVFMMFDKEVFVKGVNSPKPVEYLVDGGVSSKVVHLAQLLLRGSLDSVSDVTGRHYSKVYRLQYMYKRFNDEISNTNNEFRKMYYEYFHSVTKSIWDYNYSEKRKESISKLNKRRSSQKDVLYVEGVFRWAVDLCNNIESHLESNNTESSLRRLMDDLCLALCLVSGRRTYEIVLSGSFSESDDDVHSVKFSGQAKTRSDESICYTIPVLGVTGKTFVGCMDVFRMYQTRLGKDVDESDVVVNKHYGTPLRRRVQKVIYPVLKLSSPDIKVTPHKLREVYAQVCNELVNQGKTPKDIYIGNILGHNLGANQTTILSDGTESELLILSDSHKYYDDSFMIGDIENLEWLV